jgi:hypothetical protein
MNQMINNVLLIIGILILVILLLGGPLMILWDWLMPTLFGLPEITFWQACGLQLLATLLFKPTSLKTNKD